MEVNYKRRLSGSILILLGVICLIIGGYISSWVTIFGSFFLGIGTLLWAYEFRNGIYNPDLDDVEDDGIIQVSHDPNHYLPQKNKQEWQEELDSLELERRHKIC